MAEFRYIEITTYEDNKVVRRIDVTGMSERRVSRVDMGVNINLNHKNQ